jgi:hypothetical protein
MKINFTITELKGLDGEIIPLTTPVHKTFATMLHIASHTDTGIDPLEATIWAMAIYKEETIDLNEAMQEAFINFIKKTEIWAAGKTALVNCITLKKKE